MEISYLITNKRLKQGDTREDGLVFWNYNKECKNGEYWVTAKKFVEYVERRKSVGRKCYAKNPEKHRARNRKWRLENAEIQRLACKKWYSENKEKSRNYNKKWKLENQHKVLAKESRRRARIKNQLCILNREDELIIQEIYKARKRISDCTGVQFHVDHIYPIAKGGLHKLSNLQLLPAKINIRKKDKILCSL
jgi:hypothetical protein